MVKSCVLVFSAFLLGKGVFANDDLSLLLPDVSDFSELSIVEKPQVYSGFDLYTMIDGGADVYFEYGFEQALSVAYLFNGSERIELQIYKMESAGAAFGIFSYARLETDYFIRDDKVMIATNKYYNLILKGKYYLVLSWNNSTTALSEVSGEFTRELVENIVATDTLPWLVEMMVNDSNPLEEIKYLRGPIALSSVYFFSHDDLFRTREAVLTHDRDKDVITFLYPDEQTAEKQFRLIKNEYQNSGRIDNYREVLNFIEFTDRKERKVTIGIENNFVVVFLEMK